MQEILHHGPTPVAIEAANNFDSFVSQAETSEHHLAANDRNYVDVEVEAPAKLFQLIGAKVHLSSLLEKGMKVLDSRMILICNPPQFHFSVVVST